MKQLNKSQSMTMLAGAVLMVIGAGLKVFTLMQIAPWFFFIGSVAFVAMQMQQTYGGTNITLKRLRRILDIGDMFFIVSSLLMLENTYHVLLPLFMSMSKDGYNTYLTYIHNNWVVLLLVACMIELYTTHRISHELGKEAKK